MINLKVLFYRKQQIFGSDYLSFQSRIYQIYIPKTDPKNSTWKICWQTHKRELILLGNLKCIFPLLHYYFFLCWNCPFLEKLSLNVLLFSQGVQSSAVRDVKIITLGWDSGQKLSYFCVYRWDFGVPVIYFMLCSDLEFSRFRKR